MKKISVVFCLGLSMSLLQQWRCLLGRLLPAFFLSLSLLLTQQAAAQQVSMANVNSADIVQTTLRSDRILQWHMRMPQPSDVVAMRGQIVVETSHIEKIAWISSMVNLETTITPIDGEGRYLVDFVASGNPFRERRDSVWIGFSLESHLVDEDFSVNLAGIVQVDILESNRQSPSAITIYPNPTTDFVSVATVTGTAKLSTVELYDREGILLQQQMGSETQILWLSGQQPGLYYIRCKFTDGSEEIQWLKKG